MRVSQVKRIRSGNFVGWKIPTAMNPNKAFNALKSRGYAPVMQKYQENTTRIALLGVRLRVAPWERAILECLLREADRIVCRALGC